MTHHKHCIRLGWPGVESCEICEAITAAVVEKQEWCAELVERMACCECRGIGAAAIRAGEGKV